MLLNECDLCVMAAFFKRLFAVSPHFFQRLLGVPAHFLERILRFATFSDENVAK